MFDFGAKWSPAAFDATVAGGNVSASPVPGLSLALLSGNLSAGLASLGIVEAPLGATSTAEGGAFALALARDRCLAVSALPLGVRDGWHAEGYAATDVSDGFTCLELTGTGLLSLLARATSLDWREPMPSAAINFAGVAAAATFRESRSRLWLFIETPTLPAVQRWFAAASAN